MKKLFALTALVTALASPAAHAAGQSSTFISLMGTATKPKPERESGLANSLSGKMNYGGAFLLEFSGGVAGLETGLVYSTREIEGENLSDATKTKAYELPVLFRLHLGPYFSLGAGGYFAKLEDPAKKDDVDYGGLGSAAIYIPLGASAAFSLDGRYHFGAKKLTHNNTSYKYKDMQFLAGFRFGF